MRITGLSAVRGSWNTMAIRSPRSSAYVLVGAAEQLLAVEADAAR